MINYEMLARALGFRDWNALQEDFIAQLASPNGRAEEKLCAAASLARAMSDYEALAEATKRHVRKRPAGKRRRK